MRMILISKLIKGISRVLQNLFMYFDGTAILMSFKLSQAGFFSCYYHLGFA